LTVSQFLPGTNLTNQGLLFVAALIHLNRDKMSCYVLREFNKQTPEWVERELRRFGTNVFGEPLYRVVWGETRLELVGGLWEDRDGQPEAKRVMNDKGETRDINLIREVPEYRWIPKYGIPRWILEKWLPPEHYGSMIIWEATRDEASGLLPLGPFPHRGEYEHSFTFEANGQYIPLTPEVVAGVARLIEAGRTYTRSQKKAALESARAKKRKDWENRVDDIVKDSQDAFGGNACSGDLVHGDKKRTADDIRFDITAEDLPDVLPKQTGFSQL
jgi:hypothetical protein